MSGSLVDQAWSQIDVNGQGFIYARDFPRLIQIINDICSETSKNNQRSWNKLIDDDANEVIKLFAKDSQFFKVYRSTFSDMFTKLVNRTLEECLGGITELNKYHNLKHPEPVVCEKPVPSAGPNIKRTSDVQPIERNIPIPVSPQASEKRLPTQTSASPGLAQQLHKRDRLIREKALELRRVQDLLADYQAKYEELRTHITESRENPQAPEVTIDHDAIIAELKYKLQHQQELIIRLRDRLLQAAGTSQVLENSRNQTQTKPQSSSLVRSLGYSVFLAMILFALIYVTVSRTRAGISLVETAPGHVPQNAIWEESPIWRRVLAFLYTLIRPGQFYQADDEFANETWRSAPDSGDAYNRIFYHYK